MRNPPQSVLDAVARQDAKDAAKRATPGATPAAPASAAQGGNAPRKQGSEKALQSACETWLRRAGIRRVLHLSPMAREHVGWPDLTFCYRCQPLAVELKRAGQLPRDSQMQCLADMEADGWHCAIVWTLDELIELIDGQTTGAARLRWQSARVEWEQKGTSP